MKFLLPAVMLAVAVSGASPVPKPGVPAVQRPAATLKPAATIALGGRPDWMVVTDDAIWVQNGRMRTIHRIDPVTSREIAQVACPGEPDSGLAAGFGLIWVPLFGDEPALIGINPATNLIERNFRIAAADPEGGIAASDDSLWLASDQEGPLLRIDPATGAIRQRVAVPPGSVNPIRVGDFIWVTSGTANLVTCVDARTGAMRARVPTGPKPRFSTSDGKFLWVLNQGDGSVTKIDVATHQVVATIALGVPGGGGEICVGGGAVWVTVLGVPLTRVDATTNAVTAQWVGAGGDSVRYGFGSLWLCDLTGGKLWRFTPAP